MENQPATAERIRKAPKEPKGEIDCPTCDNKRAQIKKSEPKSGAGKFYIDCDGCGLIMPTRQKFQEYVLEHGRFFGPDGEPAAPKSPATATEKKQAAAASVVETPAAPPEQTPPAKVVPARSSRDDI